ncbi:hypothetical protein R6Q57_017578 [Mikania cordata]
MDGDNARPVEFDDSNLYHYAIFSDNVVVATIVVMFKMKEHNGAYLEIKAVEDFIGGMKPWLDIGMNQFDYFGKYVDYDMEFVLACNFGH